MCMKVLFLWRFQRFIFFLYGCFSVLESFIALLVPLNFFSLKVLPITPFPPVLLYIFIFLILETITPSESNLKKYFIWIMRLFLILNKESIFTAFLKNGKILRPAASVHNGWDRVDGWDGPPGAGRDGLRMGKGGKVWGGGVNSQLQSSRRLYKSYQKVCREQ